MRLRGEVGGLSGRVVILVRIDGLMGGIELVRWCEAVLLLCGCEL